MAILKEPPEGEPEREIGVPEHPLTLAALTTGKDHLVIVMLFEVAVLDEAQFELEVRTQDTTSPLLSDEEVKLLLFVPALFPLILHWKEGELPPLLALATKLMAEPWHDGLPPELMEMLTAGVTEVPTDMVMVFELTEEVN